MPAPRPPPPCLFCAFAPPRPQTRPPPHAQRAPRLPRVQTACRSTFAVKRLTLPDRPPRDDSTHGDAPQRWGGLDRGKQGNRDSASRQPEGRWGGFDRYKPWDSSSGQPAMRLMQGASLEGSVSKSLDKMRQEMSTPEYLESVCLSLEELEKQLATFNLHVAAWLRRARPEVRSLIGERGRTRELERRLRYMFFAQVFGGKFTQAELENQKEVADLRHPAHWYPLTRALKRTVHLHVGPTNSGKTYHALKRLEEAETGLYLGPLRLLAHEVYTRLNAKGKPCALVTGEEQRVPEGGKPTMWSCTVEMAPLNEKLDVAVIDEIQMINHKERGWAWTQAFLGIHAKEVHLCGEARAVPLIKELSALVGDRVVVHEYERLTTLQPAKSSFEGNLKKNLEKGDCIVSFSVLGIHALRRTIEETTGRKCAIVYGSLPPETRAQQARLFNDPDNDYDYLVASDAIGMGLNLSIKRVVFESTMKNNGKRLVPLEVSEVKQIAGRAGRYKSAHEAVNEGQAQSSTANGLPGDSAGLDAAPPKTAMDSRPPKSDIIGYATTLEAFDMPYLVRCMSGEAELIKTAGLAPPTGIVERFASYFPPGTPFSYIMLRLNEIAEIHPRFHLCTLKDQLTLADAIHPIKNLTIQDRLSLCAAPTGLKTPEEHVLFVALAKCIANNETGDILELPIYLEVLDLKPSAKRDYLYKLEQLHKSLVLYLWLSYRFPNVFTTRPLANYSKKLVEDAIEKTLNEFTYTQTEIKTLLKRRAEAAKMIEEARLESLKPKSESTDDAQVADEEIPAEVRDVLNDEQSFASDTTSDDMDEYPSPELEAEEIAQDFIPQRDEAHRTENASHAGH